MSISKWVLCNEVDRDKTVSGTIETKKIDILASNPSDINAFVGVEKRIG